MTSNTSIKQWVVTGTDNGFDGLQLQDAQLPKVGDSDVLVKFHAASLNYRDLIIPLVSCNLLCVPSEGMPTAH